MNRSEGGTEGVAKRIRAIPSRNRVLPLITVVIRAQRRGAIRCLQTVRVCIKWRSMTYVIRLVADSVMELNGGKSLCPQR